MSAPVVSINHVTKRFGGYTAVKDLSFDVPGGGIFGLLGPNGAGKSTTIRMIMDIIEPDDGTITLFGRASSSRDLSARVGFLPEERGLYKKMSVRRLLRYYGALKGVRQPELDRRIGVWMDRMNLGAWLDKKVDALSKGMAQKVQFIAGVLPEPELLILDEPFSGLDPLNSEVLREAVLEAKKAGTTVVFSTHDMQTAEDLCDRIFMIYNGDKVLDGTLAEIQDQHGFDTIRVRTDDGADALRDIDGVEEVTDMGNSQEVRWGRDPQELLQALAAKTRVSLFEVARPSLREIFVKIAGTEKGDHHESA